MTKCEKVSMHCGCTHTIDRYLSTNMYCIFSLKTTADKMCIHAYTSAVSGYFRTFTNSDFTFLHRLIIKSHESLSCLVFVSVSMWQIGAEEMTGRELIQSWDSQRGVSVTSHPAWKHTDIYTLCTFALTQIVHGALARPALGAAACAIILSLLWFWATLRILKASLVIYMIPSNMILSLFHLCYMMSCRNQDGLYAFAAKLTRVTSERHSSSCSTYEKKVRKSKK